MCGWRSVPYSDVQGHDFRHNQMGLTGRLRSQYVPERCVWFAACDSSCSRSIRLVAHVVFLHHVLASIALASHPLMIVFLALSVALARFLLW
jgi:hypothetical protein